MRLPLVVGCLLCLLSRRSSGIHLKTPEKAAKSLADTPPPKNQLAARLARLPEPGEEGYNVTVYNRTGACPWDPKEEWELLVDPPWPTGAPQTIYLPNDSTPGTELSLTVPGGGGDKYPFHVPAGGFGGRRVDCLMPVPAEDNDAAMYLLAPLCHLSDPPELRCAVCDAWFDKAPGGPLHELIAAAAQFAHGPVPGTTTAAGQTLAAPSNGTRDLYRALDLLDAFQGIQKQIKTNEWRKDLFDDEKKKVEDAAKDFAKDVKARRDLYGAETGFRTRGDSGWYGRGASGNANWELKPRSHLWIEALYNTSVALEKRIKAQMKKEYEVVIEEGQRWKERRKELTAQWLGVEELDINGRDVWGRTPLHWAAAEGKELLQHLTSDDHEQPPKPPAGGGGAGGAPGGGAGRSGAKEKEEKEEKEEEGEGDDDEKEQKSPLAGSPPSPFSSASFAVASEEELDEARVPGKADWAGFLEGLLARGAAPNLCDVDGRTPLDLAVTAGNAGSVAALLRAGSGRNSRNRWGHALDDIAYHPRVYPRLDPAVLAALGLPPKDPPSNGTTLGSGSGSGPAATTNSSSDDGDAAGAMDETEEASLLDYLANVAS